MTTAETNYDNTNNEGGEGYNPHRAALERVGHGHVSVADLEGALAWGQVTRRIF